MPDLTDVKVGDTLWVVSTDKRRYVQNSLATVTKVGRRWLTAGDRMERRFDRNNGYVDSGNYSPMYVAWKSKEEHDAAVLLSGEWDKLLFDVRHSSKAPDGMTVERIREARKLLGPEDES